jgi:hypothetical protein
MRDDDEITGVHGLPLSVQVVVMSMHDRHKALSKSHERLSGDVEAMDKKIDGLASDAEAVKKTARLIAWMIGILCAVIAAVGGGHLAMMHH